MTEEADSPPLHKAQEGEVPPQISQSEGALAHEEHGYSVRTPQPSEKLSSEALPVVLGEEKSNEVTFEQIKSDVLQEAKEERGHVVFNGFYTNERNRRMYARVIKGDFRPGVDPVTVEPEYDKNLTPEETDEIRKALYEQFGAEPPSEEEFDVQKKPYHYPEQPLATVKTASAIPGIEIKEIRHWRELHEDIAAVDGRDPLEFTQWAIIIEGDDFPEFTVEQAEDALRQLNAMMDENRHNENPAVMKSLDFGRRYLETFLSDKSREITSSKLGTPEATSTGGSQFYLSDQGV